MKNLVKAVKVIILIAISGGCYAENLYGPTGAYQEELIITGIFTVAQVGIKVALIAMVTSTEAQVDISAAQILMVIFMGALAVIKVA